MSGTKSNFQVFWVIFIILYLFAIGSMIATLVTEKWVEIDPNNDDNFTYTYPVPGFPVQPIIGKSYKFKGSLTTLTDGLDALNTYMNPAPLSTIDLSNKPYSKVGCGLCFIVDVSEEDTFDETLWDFYNSWCSLFKRLWFAAGFYTTLEVMSLVSCLAVILIIMLFIQGKPHSRLAFLFSNAVWVFHYLAILVWIGLTKARFDDDCENLYNSDQTNPEVCAKAGPKVGVFILIYLPFITIPFLIYVYLKHKDSKKVVTEKTENSGREINSVKAEKGNE